MTITSDACSLQTSIRVLRYCNLIDRPVTRWLGEREVKWFHEYYSLLTFQYHLKSAQGVSRVWLLDRVFWSDLSLRPGCITGGGQARPREYPLTVQNVEQIFITRRDNPPAIVDNYNNTSYHVLQWSLSLCQSGELWSGAGVNKERKLLSCVDVV